MNHTKTQTKFLHLQYVMHIMQLLNCKHLILIMYHMKNLKLILGIVILSLIAFSCSNNNSSKKSADALDDIVVDELESIVENTSMPTSYEIIELLNKTGAGYIFDVTNPPENIENYISYRQKAINLGIYAADLTYTTTYKKKDETSEYLDNFVGLVSDLEISTLDQAFFESLQNNLDNRDSLMIIVKKAQDDTYNFLNETGQNELALYALTGSFIEGLYLVNATIKFANDKQTLYELLLKNKKTLSEIINLMDSYKGDEGFKDLHVSLNKISKLFDKLGRDSQNVKVIKELKSEIVGLRNSLI